MIDETQFDETRRVFLKQLATATGSLVLLPIATGCDDESADPSSAEPSSAEPSSAEPETAAEASPEAAPSTPAPADAVPRVQPEDWNAIAFNRERGNAGAIPESYRASINGPEGENGHLGKHLPYIPEVPVGTVPTGFLALMWGDPSKGHARHPNAPVSEANAEGHWYDSIKVRKAIEESAQEMTSSFPHWPPHEEEPSGTYAVLGGGEITGDSGKNTIYLVQLPDDVTPGDTVRVHAHCLTHGEYVDFLTVPPRPA